jgi:hypothetical protein
VVTAPRLKVKFIRHRTARAILRAFGGGEWLDAKGRPIPGFDAEAVLKREGSWGFAQGREDGKGTKEVHYWTDGRRSARDLARLFGHELGHIYGKRLSGYAEELRADTYADVVERVVAELARGRR